MRSFKFFEGPINVQESLEPTNFVSQEELDRALDRLQQLITQNTGIPRGYANREINPNFVGR